MRYLSPLGSRLSQGQGLLRIDWSNPLTRGLRLLMPIRHRGDVVNLVTGQKGTASSSLSSTAGRLGRGALFGSSAYLDFQDPGGITSGTQPITIAWRQEPRAPSGHSAVLNWKPSGATNAFLIYQSDNSGYHFTCGPRAGVPIPFFAMGAPVNGRVDTYVLVVAGGTDSTTASNYTLFRNGVRHTNSSASAFGSNTTASARIGALDSGGDPFEGLISDLCIYSRALSDSEARTLSNNIAQLYEPERRIWVPVEVGAGGATLTVQDASHAHAADALILTSQSSLAVADATHSHAADSLTLTLASVLTIADAVHEHTADSPTLTLPGSATLTIADAAHGHAADEIGLSAQLSLVIADAIHAHGADSVTLNTGYTDLELSVKILRNRKKLDPGTGLYIVYDDDGVTVLLSAQAWEDAAGTIPYRGGDVRRLDRLT